MSILGSKLRKIKCSKLSTGTEGTKQKREAPDGTTIYMASKQIIRGELVYVLCVYVCEFVCVYVCDMSRCWKATATIYIEI